MEKIVKISDKEVHLKTHAGALFIYKKYFNRDALADLWKMAKVDDDNIESLDFDVLYRFAWTFAKIADEDIPPIDEWLCSFEIGPLDFVQLIFPTIKDLLSKELKTTKTAKKK